MKKTGITAAMILWCFLAVRLLAQNINTDKNVVDVFNSFQYASVSSTVEAFGEYGVTHLTTEEKTELAASFASCIGVDNGYSVESREEDNKEVLTLTRDSRDALTVIKIITLNESSGIINTSRQYVSVSLNIKKDTDCVITYKDMIQDLFDAAGIDGYVGINLRGEIPGALNYYERNRLADSMLEMLDAKVVSESRENELFTIYAYSSLIDEYITCLGKKMNINIVTEYDEEKNMTVLYLSTPLNNLDY